MVGWIGCGCVTIGTAVAASLGHLSLALAGIAVLAGAGLAIVVDAWHAARSMHLRLAQVARPEALNESLLDERLGASRAATIHAVRNALTHQTSEIEALLQVLPSMRGEKVLPPSGAFAMDARALAELTDVVRSCAPRLVVELGSGTSTVWVARLLAGTGARMVSIDHDEHYAQATRRQLHDHGLDDVAHVRVAPLVDREDGSRWYDLAAIADLDGIDLLIVDGPPGYIGPYARRPALEEMRPRLSAQPVVALDDIVRDEEQQILTEWLERWPEFRRVDAEKSTLAVLRLAQA